MFQYLYIQTEYSILQSFCRIKPLVKEISESGFTSLGIADEGTMYGTIKFYQECLANNIKPVIGLKVTYSLNDNTSTILLYASNQFGYSNLMKISSRMKLLGGVIDFDYLKSANVGIIAVVPFEDSIFKRIFEYKNYSFGHQMLHLLQSTFNIFYIGFGIESLSSSYISEIVSYGYKCVALPKVNFISHDDFDAYITLKSIKNNGELYQPLENESIHYLYDLSEIEYLYKDYPQMIVETSNICSLCNLTIEFGTYQLPLYQDGLDSFAYLKELCYKGLEKRFSQFSYSYDINAYYDRLSYELQVIKKMGFCDYFLIVYDYVKFAKKENIFVGPGRGSAPASLVAFTLGITDVDPIYHKLLFERFLNVERVSMPDIDIDFQDDRRDEVIKYVGRKYGSERVAHILTFGTFRVKQAINDCSRVYKLSDIKQKEISKVLSNAIIKNPNYSLKKLIESDQDLLDLMMNHDDINTVLTIASKIQDVPKNISTHAAGIVITKHDLVNYTPLDVGLDDIYQTQYDAVDLERLGLLKMDFLGLKNLTNIVNTIKLIKKDNPSFVLPKDENDKETYNLLAKGDLNGVFQLESAGMRKVIMELKTSSFEDITHALALYRPGPMEVIPSFIRRKFKKEAVSYIHPDLLSILEETYGMIVYQDQIMLIACKIAGYSLGRADILRRAVSKKKKEVLESERENFVLSSVNNGYSNEDANEIYDYIVKFAEYGFNKAHSVAYAKVAYITAYLKCHYFSYYMSSLMSSFLGSSHEVIEYTKEALRRNIKVSTPHINKSMNEFCVIDGTIYFPLQIIRGLGDIKTNQIIEERNKALFESYEDFIIRTKSFLPTNLVENLIYGGALDCFGISKKAMVESIKQIIDKNEYSFVQDMLETTFSTEEYSYGMLQEKEKEVLGLNISYNFFKQFSSIYNKYRLVKIEQLTENQNARTIGIVQSVKSIKTKNGENMAFVEIADDTSKIELVFFPRVYEQTIELKSGMIIMAKGRTSYRSSLQIAVDAIMIV